MSQSWKRCGRRVAQVVAAGALFSAGVVYTVDQQHPQFQLPAAGLTLSRVTVPSGEGVLSLEAQRIATVLKQYTKDTSAAQRIAGAIVAEGERRKLDPTLLVGILLTEDNTLDTMARSNVGAAGLMQVMPIHSGKWGCGSSNLFHIESNICHGASILEDAVRGAPNMRMALLRYNGCVRGKNTPNCHTYPDKVFRAANRTTEQLIALAQ